MPGGGGRLVVVLAALLRRRSVDRESGAEIAAVFYSNTCKVIQMSEDGKRAEREVSQGSDLGGSQLL